MRARTKTILETNKFCLTKHTNQKTKNFWYTIKVIVWRMDGKNVLDDMRDLFDPGKNRGGKYSCAWKFKNRAEAEKLLTMAILKWGE